MSKYRLFFWDFDGVIKDSVEVKTHAFKKLFSNLDKILVDKIISPKKPLPIIYVFKKNNTN